MHLERFGELYEHDNEKMRTGDCPTPKYESLTCLPPIINYYKEEKMRIRKGKTISIIKDTIKQRLLFLL